MLRTLVDNIREYAIIMLDPKGHVTTWSPTAERLKGYRAEEIVGKHFSTFYTREDVASGKTDRELETAVRDGRFEPVPRPWLPSSCLCLRNVHLTNAHCPYAAHRQMAFSP